MGLSLDEATALIGNMEASGLDAAKMMPGLNTAIKKLASEGVTDMSAGLQDAIASIQNATSDTEALGLATDLFGAGAGIRFKDAIDKGAFALDDLLAAMGDSEGKVADLGAATLTMSDKFDVMKNRTKAMLSPIGELATGLGPMVVMIPAIATGMSALGASQIITTAATWLQTAAMAALNIAMGPVGLIILGIVAAIAAAILIFKNWDKIILVLKSTWDTVAGAIKSVFNSKLGWLLPGGALIKALFMIRDNWDTIWNGMLGVVRAIANPIIGVINSIIGAINGLFGALNNISIGWEKKVLKGLPDIPGFGPWSPFNIQAIKQIPSLAAGGIVTSPTLAMIGESGPEAVVPLGRGGNMGGITINIMGPTYGMDDFEDKVAEAIRDGARRGGFEGILQTV